MSVLHIWQDETDVSDGEVTAAVTLESSAGGRRRLWYRFPAEHRGALTESIDPFILGALFTAMREGTDLAAHGTASPSLLRNLEEFIAAWHHWLPERYAGIGVESDETAEEIPADDDAALVAFSGGVDGAFTAYRHRKNLCGRLRRDIRTGVMAHGFDIPLDDTESYRNASDKAARMLESVDVRLIRVVTNIREFGELWIDSHGAAVASCLTLFKKGYGFGLIGSTEPYNKLVLPWGSNPVTDWMFGSDPFTIIHDGASFTRSEKIRVIAEWPEALKYLRVCWRGDLKDRNCGSCEKCIRTILNFRVHGIALPECFEKDVTDKEISGLTGLNPVPLAYLEEILGAARAASIDESWVGALERCIERNKRALRGWRKRLRDKRNEIALRSRLRRYIARRRS